MVDFREAGSGTSAGLPQDRLRSDVRHFLLNVSPGPHISRFFLYPEGKEIIAVFLMDLFDFRNGEWVQLLNPDKGDVPCLEFLLPGQKLVIDFSGTINYPADFLHIHFRIVNYFMEYIAFEISKSFVNR